MSGPFAPSPPPLPPPVSQPPAIAGAAVQRARPLRQLWREIRESFHNYIRHDIKRVLAFSILGFALGWLINVALLGFVFNGQSKVPFGAPATGTSELNGPDPNTPGPVAPTLILGSVFWLVFSTVLFALISYRLEVGREEFWSDVRGYPHTVGLAFSTLGIGAFGVVMWGFAGAMLIELLMQPALTAVIAVGVALAAAARVLRPVVTEFFLVIWRSLEKVLPSRGAAPPAMFEVTVGTAGGVAAALIGIFFDALWIRLLLIGIAIVIAFALRFRPGPAGPHAAMLVIICIGIGAGALLALAPHGAYALDGGFEECGGDFFAWFSCAGSALVFAFSALGGGMSAVGAVLGGGLGSLLAGGRGGDIGGGGNEPSAPSPPIVDGPAQPRLQRYGPAPAMAPPAEGLLQPPDQPSSVDAWPSSSPVSTPPTGTAPGTTTPATVDVVVSGQEAIDMLSKGGKGSVTVGGRTGLVAPDWPKGLGYTPLTDANGTPLVDPSTGRPLIDPSQPIALVTSTPAPTGPTSTLTGTDALQALSNAGFPVARNPVTGDPLRDPSTGNPYLQPDPNLIYGNVTGTAYGTKTVKVNTTDGTKEVTVIDPSAPIVVTTQAPGTGPMAPPPPGPPAPPALPGAAPPAPAAPGPADAGGTPPKPPPPPAPPVQQTSTVSPLDINKNIPTNPDGTLKPPDLGDNFANLMLAPLKGTKVGVATTDGGRVLFTFGNFTADMGMTVAQGKLVVTSKQNDPITALIVDQAQAQLDAQNANRVIDSVRVDAKGVHVTWHAAKT
jgi:MFS family permease